MREFRIDAPTEAVADLRRRLAETRLPQAVSGAGWRYGADVHYLSDVIAYWRDGFDWRAAEQALNRLPQFTAEVEGLEIHFVRLRGRGPDPAPLILTHGWPSSFSEFATLAPMLADPGAHDGDPADAFDVIVPSLPGFGFSEAPSREGVSHRTVARLWDRLMTETLGYERYFAHGGDFGANVTNRLGRFHGEHAAAIHVLSAPRFKVEGPLSPAERAFEEVFAAWELEEGAYGHQQRTRPQTLAFGLNDSPAGLAAWIIEKWRAWSDCAGDVESRFSKDQLLTNVSIYWFTRSIGSSMRLYWENAHQPDAAWSANDRVDVPARVFLTREPVDKCPREYAERIYRDLSFGEAPTGGHFLAAEEPELLARDIRKFFRPQRARLRERAKLIA